MVIPNIKIYRKASAIQFPISDENGNTYIFLQIAVYIKIHYLGQGNQLNMGNETPASWNLKS